MTLSGMPSLVHSDTLSVEASLEPNSSPSLEESETPSVLLSNDTIS